MGLDGVGRETDELDVALGELGLVFGQRGQLGGADWGVILRVGEENHPVVARPLVKVDGADGGFGLEVGGNRAQPETRRGGQLGFKDGVGKLGDRSEHTKSKSKIFLKKVKTRKERRTGVFGSVFEKTERTRKRQGNTIAETEGIRKEKSKDDVRGHLLVFRHCGGGDLCSNQHKGPVERITRRKMNR